MDELKGTEIINVYTHYENIVVNVNGKAYYISPKDLTTILSEFDFLMEKKRVRTWLFIDPEDWTIEKKNQPRT